MADEATCGSFDIFVPLSVALSHSWFFPHRKSLKTLLQPLLTNKEFFNIGLYKSYFAKYGSYDHTSVVRAVCVFVHIDFTVMLACCPL